MYMMMRNPAQVLFVFTSAILAYLVLPPFFFILHTSLVTDRGLQAGTFTIQHFVNIIDSLGDVRTLLSNSLIYAVSSSAVALVYGTSLAWLAERSDAPFRKLAYISAYVSFAIPGIIKVVGWIMLIGLVALGLIPYYRITSKTYKFTTISGKNFRPNRIALGKWRWLGGLLMLVLPLLQFLPIVAIAWSSFLPFAQVPSRKALSLLTLNNYVTAFNDSGVIRSVLNSMTVSVSSATVAVVITFFAAWLIVRASIKGRWLLDQMSMLPLVFPGIVMGIAILKMYLMLPVP